MSSAACSSCAFTAQLLAQHLNIPLLDSTIRHSNVISKAMTTLQQDIIDYAPDNTAVQDYIALVNELFARGLI